MEHPREKGGLTEQELNELLSAWVPPEPRSAAMRAAIFPVATPWWRRAWQVSIRIPMPVAVVLALLLIAFVWYRPDPPPRPERVVVQTERVEVPVIKERVVYRDRAVSVSPLQPVAELRPRIIRRNDASQN